MESKNSRAIPISEEFGHVLLMMSFEGRLGEKMSSPEVHSIKVSRLTFFFHAWKLL